MLQLYLMQKQSCLFEHERVEKVTYVLRILMKLLFSQ